MISADIYLDQIKAWNDDIKLQMTEFKSRLSLPPINSAFQRVVEKAMTLGYLMGAEKISDKVTRDLSAKKGRGFADEDEWGLSTFDDAMRMIRAKGVMRPEQFKAASSAIKSASFSIQRIERYEAIKAIKQSLIKAVDHGLVFEDWLAMIDDIWVAHGITPLSLHHLETVYRTNMGSAYEIASDEAARDNPYVWGYEYSGIMDGRESDICRPFFGMVKPKDDPVWSVARPLNHYNCRCTLIPVTQFDIAEMGVKETQTTPDTSTVHPDFQDNPRTMAAYNTRLTKYAQQKEREILELDAQIQAIE